MQQAPDMDSKVQPGMAARTNAMRFASTAMIMKQPVLVTLTIVFVLALLSTQFDPAGSSSGGIWGWLGLAVLLIICALIAWMLGSSQEVVIDGIARRVTQRYRFLYFQTANNEWDLADFTGVRVERATRSEKITTTSPGSGSFAKTGSKTTYNHSYSISLLRADTVVTTSDRKIDVPHHPLKLPMDEPMDPLALEAIALRLARLGGWLATRRGYMLVSSATFGAAQGAFAVNVAPDGVESPINVN